jgi:phage-related protein
VHNLTPGLLAIVRAFLDIATVGSGALPDLATKMSDLAKKFADFITQARDSGALKEFMQTGIDLAKTFFSILKNLGDIVSTVFSAFNTEGGGTLQLIKDLTGRLAEFLHSVEGQAFLHELGATLKEIGDVGLKIVFDLLAKVLPLLTDLAPAVRAFADGIGTFLGAALTVVGPLLVSLGNFITDNPELIKTLATALGIWAAAQWVLNIAMDANPIGAVIVGIVALIAGVQWVADHWPEITAWVQDVQNKFAIWMMESWNSIWKAVSDFVTKIRDWIVNKWNEIGQFFDDINLKITTAILTTWNNIWKWVTDRLTDIRNFFVSTWNSIWKNVTDFFTGLGNLVKTNLDSIGRWFSELPGNIGRALGNLGNMLKDAGRNIINGFLNGIKDAFRDVSNFVTGIGPWIVAHKGPASYDRQLLVNAGVLVMSGFHEGLKSKFAEVMDFVTNVGPQIAAAAGSADIQSSLKLSTVLGGTSGTLGTIGAASSPTAALTTAAAGSTAVLERQGGGTITIQNLNIAGNFDPTNPTAWRQALVNLKDGLRDVEREHQ